MAISPSFWAGFWRLADPKISLASFASLFLGACLAAHDGPLHWGWLALTVAGIFAIEVAKNASGEIVDYDSGTDLAVAAEDRSPFSGGKRVLVDRLLSRRECAAIAAIGYLLGAAAGVAIVLGREPRVLLLGVVGVACAFFYHGPPLRLAYRGFGEAAVALCYGPLIAAGAYLVQRGEVSRAVWLLSLPLGVLIGAFLWANEFPDYRADLACGKRNLVVRLGRAQAAEWFLVWIFLAFSLLAGALLAGAPLGAMAGAAAAIPAFKAVQRLLAAPESTPAVIPAQGLTLAAFVVYALAAGTGILLA